MIERIAFAMLLLLVFTVPWEKSLAIAGIGTVAKLVGIPALLAGAISALMHRSLRSPALALVTAAAFMAWSAVTWFWSLDGVASLARSLTFLQLLLMFALVWQICRTPSQIRALMGAYIAGAAVASAATVFRYGLHLQTYYRRYAAPGFDPNDLGITVALAIPLALYLALDDSTWRRWLWRGAVVLCCTAVLLSASRAALIASVLGFLFVPGTWKISTGMQRVWGVLLFASLAAGTFVLAPRESRQRIATMAQEVRTGTLHKRTTIWKAGLRAWKNRRLTGVGSGAYPDAVKPLIGVPGVPGHEYVAHNTFLSVLVETGAIGFVLFGSFVGVLLIYIWAMPLREGVLWATVLAVWAAGAVTLTWEHRKAAWILFALLTVQWALSFRPERSR